MMLRRITIVLIVLIEMYVFQLWLVSGQLNSKTHFAIQDANLKLQDVVSNDAGYNTYAVRFFHNKVVIYGTEFINKYLIFWDLGFDVLFLTLVGYFGILYGFWYIVSSKKFAGRLFLIFFVFFILPLLDIFQLPSSRIVRFLLISLPLYGFSLFGIWQFMNGHKRLGIFVIFALLMLSIWYISVFQKEIQIYY